MAIPEGTVGVAAATERRPQHPRKRGEEVKKPVIKTLKGAP